MIKIMLYAYKYTHIMNLNKKYNTNYIHKFN